MLLPEGARKRHLDAEIKAIFLILSWFWRWGSVCLPAESRALVTALKLEPGLSNPQTVAFPSSLSVLLSRTAYRWQPLPKGSPGFCLQTSRFPKPWVSSPVPKLLFFLSALSLCSVSVFFLRSSIAGDLPRASSHIGSGCAGRCRVQWLTNRILGLAQCSPRERWWAVPLPSSFFPPCPPSSSLQFTTLLFHPILPLSLIIIVPDNATLGRNTQGQLSRQRSVILNLKLAIWAYFRSS